MIYLQAFLVGGLLCAVFQLVWMATKASPLTLLKIGFVLAAILASFGVTAKLVSFADAGFFVMVVGAGDATYSGTVALLSGNPVPLVEFFAVIVLLVLFGLIGGYLAPSGRAKNGKDV